MPEGFEKVVHLAGSRFDTGMYQRPQALASAFCEKGFPSIYATQLSIHRAPLALRRVAAPAKLKIRAALSLPQSLAARSRLVRRLNRAAQRARIRPWLTRDTLVIASGPVWAESLQGQRDRCGAIVYDCFDEYAMIAPNHPLDLNALEAILVRESTLVTVTAEALKEKVRSIHPDAPVLDVPNAVEFARFRAAAGTGKQLRQRLGIKGPVAGFLGAIYDWVDEPLLHRLATELPDVTLLLCGPVRGFDVSRLEKLPNVRFTGMVPYDQVPTHIDAFDVAFIACRLIERMKTVKWNKYYLYLCMGKPIVTVDIPSAHEFGDLMLVAENAEDFCEKVRAALGADFHSPERIAARISYAEANSWQKRAETILAALAAG